MNCDQDCRAGVAKGIAGMALILALLLMMGGCESRSHHDPRIDMMHRDKVLHNHCVNTLLLEPGTDEYWNCRLKLSEMQANRQAQESAVQAQRRSQAWQNFTQDSLRILGY